MQHNVHNLTRTTDDVVIVGGGDALAVSDELDAAKLLFELQQVRRMRECARLEGVAHRSRREQLAEA